MDLVKSSILSSRRTSKNTERSIGNRFDATTLSNISRYCILKYLGFPYFYDLSPFKLNDWTPVVGHDWGV